MVKTIFSAFLVTLAIFGIFSFLSDMEENRKKEMYSLSELEIMIENSDTKEMDFNIYNSNYVGNSVSKVYCNLDDTIETFLIMTYYYHFKDNMEFTEFVYSYGFSSYYEFIGE